MKKLIVKKAISEISVEDVLLDNLAYQREKESGGPNIKMERPLKRANFAFLLCLAFVFLAAVFVFCFKFQIVSHAEFEQQAQANRFVSARSVAERGIIYDRSMRQLVKNEIGFDLFFHPEKARAPQAGKPAAVDVIADILREKPLEIQKKIDSGTSENLQEGILLKKDLTNQDLVVLETKQEETPYLEVKRRFVRTYDNDICLGNTLGYLSKIPADEYAVLKDQGYSIVDYIGRAGLEKTQEQALREKLGVLQIERNAQGKEISRELVTLPESGDNVVLALDLDLQKKSYEVLKTALDEIGVQKGAVVALDPQNNEVLSAVSLPCFDNNLFSGGISQEDLAKINADPQNPQLNRFLAGVYPTGSIIKPFIALAALEEGVITESTRIYCPQEICIENQYNKEIADCYPDNKFHGWSDVKRALAESINPFFYIIGGGYKAPSPTSKFFNLDLPKSFVGLGVERIDKYLNLFGLGQATGIDLPGEQEGKVPSPAWKAQYFKTPATQKWLLGDTYNLSIGQGYMLATPLQMAVAFSAIANGGKLLQPKFVKEVVSSDKSRTTEIPASLVRENFVSSANLQIVREGMRQVVASPAGSAAYLNSLPFEVAVKTGTAQMYTNSKVYDKWIAAFAPYDDLQNIGKNPPKILLLVFVEGAPDGTPNLVQRIAKDILDWYFLYKIKT
ncbi:MAG: penicillin-binding protein 2 [Patescibacteria group bacterium]|nr:penicillin-binding protein 2 [Patescibacteria group bacterium]